MKKIIYSLVIALALSFIVPTTARAEEIKCMCNGGEECRHGLPARTFATFEEWEDYYLSHRKIGIFWDSYLYKSFAWKYDENGKTIWKPNHFYPFTDIETWKYWFNTCLEKQRTGEYKYEWPYGVARK